MDAIAETICRKRETMSRYIDAEVLKETFNSSINTGHESFDLSAICECIDFETDVDVEPVRHAHWEIQEYEFLTCSDCGGSYYTGCDCTSEAKEKLENGDCYNYCPHCGAKMDESVT